MTNENNNVRPEILELFLREKRRSRGNSMENANILKHEHNIRLSFDGDTAMTGNYINILGKGGKLYWKTFCHRLNCAVPCHPQ